MIEAPCTTCAEVSKTEKKKRLEINRIDTEAKGRAQAIAEGRQGYVIAKSKNGISYIAELDIPDGSSLEWEYISIR